MGHRKGAGPVAAATVHEAREPIGIGKAESSKASPHSTQAPIFVVRLLATRPDAIRGLRWVIKRLGRAHGLRCLSIDQDRGQP